MLHELVCPSEVIQIFISLRSGPGTKQDPTDINSQSSSVYNPYPITTSSQAGNEDDDLIKSLKAKEREELSARYQDFRAHYWHQFSPSLWRWPDRSWQPFQWPSRPVIEFSNEKDKLQKKLKLSQEDSQRPWVWQDWIIPTDHFQRQILQNRRHWDLVSAISW